MLDPKDFVGMTFLKQVSSFLFYRQISISHCADTSHARLEITPGSDRGEDIQLLSCILLSAATCYPAMPGGVALTKHRGCLACPRCTGDHLSLLGNSLSPWPYERFDKSGHAQKSANLQLSVRKQPCQQRRRCRYC